MVFTLNVEFTGVNLLQILQLEKLASSWSRTSRQPYRITPGRTTHSEFVYASWKHKPKTSLFIFIFSTKQPRSNMHYVDRRQFCRYKNCPLLLQPQKIKLLKESDARLQQKNVYFAPKNIYNKTLEFWQLPIDRWWWKCCVNVYISGNRKLVFTSEYSVTWC